MVKTTIKTKTRSTLGIALTFLALSFAAALASVMLQQPNGKTAGVKFAATGTVYYVDATSGNDANDGKSETKAWKTLNKVSSTAMAQGSSVLFKRGQTWRGQLGVYQPGIGYGAYGTGANPIISGADTVTTWTKKSSTVYTAPLATAPAQVFFAGTRGTKVASESAVNGTRKWFWANGTLSVYGTATPSNVEATVRKNVINIYNANSGLVKDITCQYAVECIAIANSNDVTIDTVTAKDNAGFGAIVISADSTSKGQRNIIKNSTITGTVSTDESLASGNRGSGIFVWGLGNVKGTTISGNTVTGNGESGIAILDSSDNTVSGNTVSGNGDVGIGFAAAATASSATSGNIIERNTVYGNAATTDDRFGINLFRVGNNNMIRFNTVYSQKDTLADSSIPVNAGYPNKYGTGAIRFDGGDPLYGGSDYIDSTGNQIYYNTIYSETDGVQIFNFSGIAVYNNTIVNSKRYGIVASAYNNSNTKLGKVTIKNNLLSGSVTHIGITQVQTADINYNAYVGDTSTSFERDGAKGNFSLWKSVTGNDANGILSTNVLFVNASAKDYHLQITSPLIDKGTSVDVTLDADGTAVPQGAAPEIGADEVVGAAPVCIENWNCGEWSACSAGTQTRTCTDTNNCGTTTTKPATSQSCTCTENWSCSDWSTCSTGTQTRTCTDSNTCGTSVSKPAESQSCTVACTPNCSGKTCGADGCGGTCGTCTTGQTCSTAGTCQASTPTYDNAYCVNKYGSGYSYNSSKNQCCKKTSWFTTSCKAL